MEKYLVEKKVGEGFFGSVYKVMNLNGKDIALKVINIEHDRLSNDAQREIRILKRISNPCFVSLACYYDSFIRDGKLYIEMEYIDGPTLTIFSDLNRLSPNFKKNLLSIIKDLTPGLIYLHSKEVIHRDIKPDNIIIEKTTFQPKLIDVGLSCVENNHVKCKNASGKCCLGKTGTVYFMPPETLLDAYSCFESDVWSLGASIYFSATEVHVCEPILKTVDAIIKEMRKEVSLIKTNNDVLDTILREMLEKKVEDRIKETEIIAMIDFLSPKNDLSKVFSKIDLSEIHIEDNKDDLLGYIY